MNEKIHTLNELVGGAFPVKISKSRLKQLIFAGEKKKLWTLPEGINYLVASNVGNGTERARWAVSDSEIRAWLERSKSARAKLIPDHP